MFNALKKNIVIMYKQMRNLNKEIEAIKNEPNGDNRTDK